MQRFAPADIPADITEVDYCEDQWRPDVSILPKVEGRLARHLFLEDMVFMRCAYLTFSCLLQLLLLHIH